MISKIPLLGIILGRWLDVCRRALSGRMLAAPEVSAQPMLSWKGNFLRVRHRNALNSGSPTTATCISHFYGFRASSFSIFIVTPGSSV